jgi:hypothetical protein
MLGLDQPDHVNRGERHHRCRQPIQNPQRLFDRELARDLRVRLASLTVSGVLPGSGPLVVVAIGIARLLVGFQHVFHSGDEAGAGVRRDHPLPFAARIERVFFRVRPIVLSLTFSTIFNSTTFSSSRRRL